MKEIFRAKSFKVLIVTLIVLVVLGGTSKIFGTSVLSSLTGYITTSMQRVSAQVTKNSSEKTYEELLAENEQLKSEIAQLRNQLADYTDIKEENQRLWKYYDLKKADNNYRFVPVNVIRRDPSSEFYSFTADRGNGENISVNDPVVTENGLVGYVSEVNASYCKVTTILSPDLSAGARDIKSSDSGIVTGNAVYSDSNLTTMTKLSETNKIKKGDQISTTGIGGMYPEKISIGTVKSLEYDDYDASLYAVIEPYEDVRNITDAIIITEFNGKGEIAEKTESASTTKPVGE
ncbi:MAG: rod shape-determining protein MreC [Ruminococcus sp.]|nr:rod shape-determining protein MreC [Ruminococcus sp.]